jgi:hypothetical protein
VREERGEMRERRSERDIPESQRDCVRVTQRDVSKRRRICEIPNFRSHLKSIDLGL